MQGKRNNVNGEKRAGGISQGGTHSSVHGHEKTSTPKVCKN